MMKYACIRSGCLWTIEVSEPYCNLLHGAHAALERYDGAKLLIHYSNAQLLCKKTCDRILSLMVLSYWPVAVFYCLLLVPICVLTTVMYLRARGTAPVLSFKMGCLWNLGFAPLSFARSTVYQQKFLHDSFAIRGKVFALPESILPHC